MKQLITSLLLVATISFGQLKNTAEQLGYPANTKLLIIHADDIGVSHSENAATIQAFSKGMVNSGSIMVPCPWLGEIGDYAKANPTADLGLHLTLTAEWKQYKWGTVVPRTEAKSLVNEQGFFPDNSQEVATKANVAEVEKEVRAQVERAKQFGIDPTHFDSHMGSLFMTPDLFKLYLRLGKEYKVPVMLHGSFAKQLLGAEYDKFITNKDVVADMIHMASPPDVAAGSKNFYTKMIKEMKPGLNVLLIHVAFDDAEMKAVTIDHPDYGAAWRQGDYDFFTSEECRRLLSDNKVQLVTWREIRDKIVRK